jgi:uroporphyrinogen decarboxylase
MESTLMVPLCTPSPDFEELRAIIKGERAAKRVHFAELGIDPEVMNYVLERYLGEEPFRWFPDEFESTYLRLIKFWYRMGYDYIRVAGGVSFPLIERMEAEDTAQLSRGTRNWVNEGIGVIASWQEFEEYPWPRSQDMNFSHYEFVAKNLPDGMGMMICPSSGVFEVASELLGLEGMSYLIHDDPDLVEAVFNRVGEVIYEFYRNLVDLEGVAGFFQGDDLGHKTATTISPTLLRQLVFPWHRKFASLAHSNDGMYWLHACGNLTEVEDDLIDYVQIDALHSFQDNIVPAHEFQERNGNRVATLGGIDVDVLCRASESELRTYVRAVLEKCMPYRYALGSGNTVANYVPVKNYLIMMDEGVRWTR